MNRLFLGLNLWGILFLVSAGGLGWVGSPWHLRVGIFAAFFACLVQCGIIALFLGAAKLIKEHVGRFDMPLTLIDRLNLVYHRLFPMAAIGAVAVAVAAVVGGLADLGRAPGWLHLGLAVGAAVYLVVVMPLEYRLHTRLHGVILDVERHLPADGEDHAVTGAGEPPAGRRMPDPEARAKALLYVGLTLPLPYLGYTFISGEDVSLLLVPTIVLTGVCLVGAAHQYRAARGTARPGRGAEGAARPPAR